MILVGRAPICYVPVDARLLTTKSLKIVDKDSGAEVPEGEVGEICVLGPQTMQVLLAQWRRLPTSAIRMIGSVYWRCWLFTDGYLYIHDRVKDTIISGGENIYPAEIENALMQHPLIADAAVIGVPSERWGETVKAITRTNDTLDEQGVIEHCRELLAGYKCPTSIDWMTEIPRNPSGKNPKGRAAQAVLGW